MKKGLTLLFLSAIIAGASYAQRITESLDNWTLGTNPPEISSGTRGDGSSGNYIHVLVGANPFYYEVMTAAEGLVDFWIYDPANCLEETDPGYGVRGPGWGLQSPLYQSAYITIDRSSWVSGCQGFSPWSTVSPYSPWWYISGLRGDGGVPYAAGWFRWSVSGTWDNITFSIYDVDYSANDQVAHGDVFRTYDATSFGGSWAALFGEGWKAFAVKGDNSTGIEDINVDVTGGTEVFAEFGTSPISRPYTRTSWGDLKQLYR
jgi:hypothetical protein